MRLAKAESIISFYLVCAKLGLSLVEASACIHQLCVLFRRRASPRSKGTLYHIYVFFLEYLKENLLQVRYVYCYNNKD